MAERAQKEPLPHQRGEDYAGHHYQDDPHSGLHVVCQRTEKAQEREQDDVGAEEQGRGGGQQQRRGQEKC